MYVCRNTEARSRIIVAAEKQHILHICVCVCMRVRACSRATNTYSEYVILIAFPRKQWLRERTSKLRLHTIYCLVKHATNAAVLLVLCNVTPCRVVVTDLSDDCLALTTKTLESFETSLSSYHPQLMFKNTEKRNEKERQALSTKRTSA